MKRILFVAAICSALAGCVYKGAKITEGTDLAVGLSVPGTDGALQVNALNWLSGFRLGVAQNATLRVVYSTADTNDYFGIIHTRTAKRIRAKVTPLSAEDLDKPGHDDLGRADGEITADGGNGNRLEEVENGADDDK